MAPVHNANAQNALKDIEMQIFLSERCVHIDASKKRPDGEVVLCIFAHADIHVEWGLIECCCRASPLSYFVRQRHPTRFCTHNKYHSTIFLLKFAAHVRNKAHSSQSLPFLPVCTTIRRIRGESAKTAGETADIVPKVRVGSPRNRFFARVQR